MKGGKGISIGKAAEKYGLTKMSLSRYAKQGLVVTLVPAGVRGQAVVLDELSVYRFVKDRSEGQVVKDRVTKKARVNSASVYGRGVAVAADALDAVVVGREFLNRCKARGYSKKSYHEAERVLMGFLQKYGDLPFNGGEVVAHVGDMKVSQQTKKLYFTIIAMFYNWVEGEYGIPTPIRKGMSPKAKRQLPRAYDAEEIKSLLSVIEDHQDKVMVNLFLATGIRVGELVSLDVEDVSLNRIHLKAQEGVKVGEAYVRIEGWLYEQLMGLGRKEGALFLGYKGGCYKGGRLTADSVTRRIIGYSKEAGITGKRRGPHTLRHTVGCNLLEATGDMDFVRQILRHKDLNTTLIYAQLRPKLVDEKYAEVMESGSNGIFQFAEVEG